MTDVVVVGGVYREIFAGSSKPQMRIGGSGLTASVAAARLGASVSLAGFAGIDDQSLVMSILNSAGVDASHVQFERGVSGTFVFPDRSLDAPLPLFRPPETSPVQLSAIPDARVLLLLGMPDFDGADDHEVQRMTSETSPVVVWDRQGWLSRARNGDATAALAASQRIWLGNKGEALEEHVSLVPPRGFTAALVKDGPRSVTLIEAAGSVAIPTYPVESINSVGTGDAYAGALAAGLATGSSLVEAATQASAVASIVAARGDNLAPSDVSAQIANILARSAEPEPRG